MITFHHKGNFKKTERFLTNGQRLAISNIFSKYGKQGVAALALATPKDTGETAASWSYKLIVTRYGYQIIWFNSHEEKNGIMPAVLIQYGHGTRGGTYIQGIDYINPAMKPIFDQIAIDIWKEVTKI